jgi:hypothetical protein
MDTPFFDARAKRTASAQGAGGIALRPLGLFVRLAQTRALPLVPDQNEDPSTGAICDAGVAFSRSSLNGSNQIVADASDNDHGRDGPHDKQYGHFRLHLRPRGNVSLLPLVPGTSQWPVSHLRVGLVRPAPTGRVLSVFKGNCPNLYPAVS